MTTQDEQFLDRVHIKIHALRLIPKYSPSPFEQELNVMFAEYYQDICEECRERVLKNKYAPAIQQKKSFLGGLFGS